jgi:acyl carrier protein
MNSNDILEKLTTILVEQLGLQRGQVTSAADIRRDLGADSLDCVELVMAVEEEFAIDITDEEAERIQTVGQAVEHIQSQL